MLPTLSVTLLACASAHVFLAFYGLIQFARRPSQRGYLWFSVLATTFMLFSIGGGVAAAAETVATATLGFQLKMAGLALTLPPLLLFAHALSSNERPHRLLRTNLVVAGIALVLNISGAFFDPNVPHRGAAYPSTALSAPPGEPTWALALFLVVTIVVTTLTYSKALLPTAISRLERPMFLGLVAGIFAGGYDTGVLLKLWSGGYTVEYALVFVATMLMISLAHQIRGTRVSLQHRTAELDVAYRQLRDAQASLVETQQLAAIGELSAVIAHEVRNPLTVMRNAVSGMRRAQTTDADRKTLLEILDEESARLDRLVRDLLSYATPIAADRHEGSVLGSVEAALHQSGTRESHAVQVEIDAALLWVVDERLIQRALEHILVNAAQSTPGTLPIRISAHRTEAAVVIDVDDSGPGFHEDVAHRAFEPFVTNRATGSGLGLAIVSRIVAAHDGDVQLLRGSVGGALVRVVVPDPALPGASTPPARRTSMPV